MLKIYDMNESVEAILGKELYNEIVVKKWTNKQKVKKRKSLLKLHRGTQFKHMGEKPRKGHKRVLVGSKRYVWKRMSSAEKISRKRVGKAVGKKFH